MASPLTDLIGSTFKPPTALPFDIMGSSGLANLNTANLKGVDFSKGIQAAADAAKVADPAAAAKAAQDALKQQILAQGITSKWSGEGFGSAEANAADMARILASIGITDIKQFGQFDRPVYQTYQLQNRHINQEWGDGYDQLGYYTDEGSTWVPATPEMIKAADANGVAKVQTGTEKVYGNKVTGQAVPNTYSERQTGNAWGGTYAGSGNTGYRVQFDAAGNPYFYTTGASSSDIANIAPLLSIASIIPSPIQPFAAAANAAIAIDQGNVLGGLASLAGIPGVSDVVGAGVTSALQTANQATNLAKAVDSGDLLAALTSGANLTGTGGVQLGDTGYTLADALKTANIANAVDQGNFAPLVGALAAQQGPTSGPKASDIEPGSFEPITEAFNPASYGLVDLQEPEPYTPTTDFSFVPDYSLSVAPQPALEEMGGAQGITAPELPEVFVPDSFGNETINYDLFAPTPSAGEPALQIPTAPNIEEMGGGQGLLPSGPSPSYVPDLGSPESFINQPAPTSGVDIEALQKQWADQAAQSAKVARAAQAAQATAAKALAAQAAQTQALRQQMAQQNQQQSLMDMLMLAGIMGSNQPKTEPIQTMPADVKSFEEQGFGDLFGSKLQFSDGGDVNDLLKLLRG